MSDYKTPNDKLISNEQARALNLSYKDKQKEGFGVEDASSFCCSSWYSLEDLEGYINYVKQEALKQRISVDGIRFYFGVYPESTEDKSKVGRNTLFMCPTKAKLNLNVGEEFGGEGADDSEDITTISAMNFGDGGNPPQNDYGE
ncbi:hypothetical protein [Kordia sp.]|uniref:hypothetical protein n=1 Tax=Kordia sp. TaxID=1965332 RepID=UPI003B5AC3B8